METIAVVCVGMEVLIVKRELLKMLLTVGAYITRISLIGTLGACIAITLNCNNKKVKRGAMILGIGASSLITLLIIGIFILYLI